MSVYLILDIEIHDDERDQRYRTEVPAQIEKHGGEYLVRGGEPRVLVGVCESIAIVVWFVQERAQSPLILRTA